MSQRGLLKIYLGYAPGVGKTYAMLQEGHRLKSQGFDVVIGKLDCQNQTETLEQISDLEIIPSRFYTLNDQSFEELNLNSILERKPQYVLIDDLAHANAPGAKNDKRFQDIIEILNNSIHVITTLNIENLEMTASRAIIPSTPASTAGKIERVPDFVFQNAHHVVHVDVSIDELRERVRLKKTRATSATPFDLNRNFSRSNLALLREASLKEIISHQSRKISEQESLNKNSGLLNPEAVMVALSSDPSNAEILIQKGTRLACRLSTRCFVVYIQKKSEKLNVIDPCLLNQLQENMQLAKSLGAEVITISSENVAESLVEFAHENHVRHAVFGKSRLSPLRERMRGSIILSFLHDSVGIDVHIVSTAVGAKRCL